MKTTRSAEGTIEIKDITNIYELDFRTSAYTTFSSKMDGISKSKYVASQVVSTLYKLYSNTRDMSNKPEVFDEMEYDFGDKENNMVLMLPDYANTAWYTSKIAPLLYENSDVKNTVKTLTPPKGNNVVTIGQYETNQTLTDTEVESGTFAIRNAYGSFCNAISPSINTDFYNTKVYLANYRTTHKSSDGIDKLIATDNLPSLTEGSYPINAQYKLPGKSLITSTKQINIEYQY